MDKDKIITELIEAIEPFTYLAEVLEEGQILFFRGVYVSQEQAIKAQVAYAKAQGVKNE